MRYVTLENSVCTSTSQFTSYSTTELATDWWNVEAEEGSVGEVVTLIDMSQRTQQFRDRNLKVRNLVFELRIVLEDLLVTFQQVNDLFRELAIQCL